MADERDESRGFKVTDRRRFSESGEERTEAPPEPPPSPAAAEAPDAPPPDLGGPGDPEADEPLTFSTFVLSLSTQALCHLGEMASPFTGRIERDLVAGKQVIDILGILAEKTRNNLDATEQSLLDAVLYDLRMRYVALVRGAAKEGA
ncbi:MAG: DUF1844 domain-containing protein [bacterium]|nr:DUF1844 domain-containing protein [bacterium]